MNTFSKAFLFTSLFAAHSSWAQEARIEVFKAADDAIFPVTSELIIGQHEVLLVDAQFSSKDAQALVEKIQATGKPLKRIFISNGDPDFYFGLDTITQAYPQAQVLATPAVVAHIKATKDHKLTTWAPALAEYAPKRLIVPTALTANQLEFEGQIIEILGTDSQTPERNILWMPSLKTAFAGILVETGGHVWLADTASKASRDTWRQQLQQLAQLKPEQVIPSHFNGVRPNANEALDFMQNYLQHAEAALADQPKAATFIERMKRHYPQLGGVESLELSAKVLTGEMQWQ
ncbi:MBL fold metallo-hydrolase [Pseudomonas sp. F1_0610]|uniref:MBL fold metallo-hydrolase n=1 Tax=Pseudomonas sp. F1_0610 TaxID=3114284 RepID=UPI0039C19E2C